MDRFREIRKGQKSVDFLVKLEVQRTLGILDVVVVVDVVVASYSLVINIISDYPPPRTTTPLPMTRDYFLHKSGLCLGALHDLPILALCCCDRFSIQNV
jgi:hypothetical protein